MGFKFVIMKNNKTIDFNSLGVHNNLTTELH